MKNTPIDIIISKLALKYNKPRDVIKAIVYSQFECARQEVKIGNISTPESYKNIRFIHLGLLVAKPGKINVITKAHERRLYSSTESVERKSS